MGVVGENVRQIRLQRGVTQMDLKSISGVGQDTISGIELGKYHPRPSTLQKLAEALEVSVEDFFAEESADPKGAAPPGFARAMAGSETERRLALLETHGARLLEIVRDLNPTNSPLDRVAVDHVAARVSEITRVLAEKTGDRSNPLASRMRDHLETEGEEAEILGVVTPEKTPRGESKQSQIKEAHEAPRGP